MSSVRSELTNNVGQLEGAKKMIAASDASHELSTYQDHPPKASSPSVLQALFSWRALVTVHMHFSMVFIGTMIQNMPYAVVCMMKEIHLSAHVNASLAEPVMTSFSENITRAVGTEMTSNVTFVFNEKPSPHLDNHTEVSKGEFDWDSSLKSLVLSSTMFLTFVLPMMVDRFSRTLGCKRVLLLVLMLPAILTLLQPVGVRASPYILVAIRIIIGMIALMIYPLVSEIFSWWAPNSEKVTMMSLAFAGPNMGGVLVSLSSGLLCSVPVDNGWPFIFYVHGALGLLWCVSWQLTGSVKPEDHPFISEHEKQYIITTRHAMSQNQRRTSPPYRKIMSSVPMWGCTIVHMAYLYCTYSLAVCVPLFYHNVLGFSVLQVGLLASLGFVAKFFGTLGWGLILNVLLRKTRWSKTICHKLVQSSSFYLSGACLVGLAVGMGGERSVAVVLMFLVMVGHSSYSASGVVVPLDMAPRFAAFLTGFKDTLALIFTSPGPFITALMIQSDDVHRWRNAFLSLAAVSVMGATCFMCMASATLQSWNSPEEDTKETTTESLQPTPNDKNDDD